MDFGSVIMMSEQYLAQVTQRTKRFYLEEICILIFPSINVKWIVDETSNNEK